MALEKLERVCWRLRKAHDSDYTFTNKDLRRAIMYEIGTAPFTLKYNTKILKELEFIESAGSGKWRLTGEDLRQS